MTVPNTPLPRRHHRRGWLLPVVLALALSGGACTSASSGDTPQAAPAASAQVSLKGVCPDPVVVQTNWWPQSEHSAAYQLVGPDAHIDAPTSASPAP